MTAGLQQAYDIPAWSVVYIGPLGLCAALLGFIALVVLVISVIVVMYEQGTERSEGPETYSIVGISFSMVVLCAIVASVSSYDFSGDHRAQRFAKHIEQQINEQYEVLTVEIDASDSWARSAVGDSLDPATVTVLTQPNQRYIYEVEVDLAQDQLKLVQPVHDEGKSPDPTSLARH